MKQMHILQLLNKLLSKISLRERQKHPVVSYVTLLMMNAAMIKKQPKFRIAIQDVLGLLCDILRS